ncbi:MAG TPA: NAD(P)H-binding protein [Solirubrobacteraceae bacterium]|nr:NAD(P)H-binding protein [Solirubrobacteraceae bacterium]
MNALVAGATGFIGSALVRRLLDDGADVRALVRDARRTRDLPTDHPRLHVHEGDVLAPDSLHGAGDGIDVAYYLVHSMGRGEGGDFEERERRAADAFAQMCTQAGVPRVIYLGGLGDAPGSKHLRSRDATARTLAKHGPALTYFRAGMVVGAGSESYRTLRHLVARLPVMITPRWLSTPTQPIDIDDVVAYLAAAPQVAGSVGREVQIGSPDVLAYGAMLDRMAVALGRRPRPKVPVPLLTPWLSSLWIGLVTPVDTRVARPLIEGLSTKTVVTDPTGAALFDIAPIGFDASLRKAVAAELEHGAR